MTEVESAAGKRPHSWAERGRGMAGAAGASTGGESSRGGETEQSDASSSKSKETLGSANFLDLPQPVKYEELQKEAFLCLKPEMFEGARLDFVKPLSAPNPVDDTSPFFFPVRK